MAAEELKELKAANIMTKRLVKVRDTDSVLDAVKKMYLSNIGAIIIVDKNDKITGIFTERDILRRIVPQGLKIKKIKISAVMTKDPSVVTSDTPVVNIFQLMRDLTVRHVPIVDNNKLVGIVSITDIAAVCMKLLKVKSE